MNPLWQQKKLREYCASKGVQLCAYSPLGARGTLWGKDWVMECETLREIAQAKGKTLAQVYNAYMLNNTKQLLYSKNLSR